MIHALFLRDTNVYFLRFMIYFLKYLITIQGIYLGFFLLDRKLFLELKNGGLN